MSRAIDFLEAHQSSTPSHWRKDAQWRRDNDYWLKYAQQITIQVMRAMDEQSVTQTELAKRIGCTQQYVSNLLKGSSNMTLETIARLEKALNLDILKSTLNVVRGYSTPVYTRQQYLNDSAGDPAEKSIKTSNLVEGYKRSRKTQRDKK